VDDDGVPAATAHPSLLLCHLPITSSLDSLSLTSSRNRRVRPWVLPRAGWGIAGRSRRRSGGSCVSWLRLRQNAPESTFSRCFSRGVVLRARLAGLFASHAERSGWEPCQMHPIYRACDEKHLIAPGSGWHGVFLSSFYFLCFFLIFVYTLFLILFFLFLSFHSYFIFFSIFYFLFIFLFHFCFFFLIYFFLFSIFLFLFPL
jgi:hypothetical protein